MVVVGEICISWEELLCEESGERWDSGEVVGCRLMEFDHEDEFGSFLTFVEIDLMRFLAKHVGISVSDEGPVGQVYTYMR